MNVYRVTLECGTVIRYEPRHTPTLGRGSWSGWHAEASEHDAVIKWAVLKSVGCERGHCACTIEPWTDEPQLPAVGSVWRLRGCDCRDTWRVLAVERGWVRNEWLDPRANRQESDDLGWWLDCMEQVEPAPVQKPTLQIGIDTEVFALTDERVRRMAEHVRQVEPAPQAEQRPPMVYVNPPPIPITEAMLRALRQARAGGYGEPPKAAPVPACPDCEEPREDCTCSSAPDRFYGWGLGDMEAEQKRLLDLECEAAALAMSADKEHTRLQGERLEVQRALERRRRER